MAPDALKMLPRGTKRSCWPLRTSGCGNRFGADADAGPSCWSCMLRSMHWYTTFRHGLKKPWNTHCTLVANNFAQPSTVGNSCLLPSDNIRICTTRAPPAVRPAVRYCQGVYSSAFNEVHLRTTTLSRCTKSTQGNPPTADSVIKHLAGPHGSIIIAHGSLAYSEPATAGPQLRG
jgi:hypothetical protein